MEIIPSSASNDEVKRFKFRVRSVSYPSNSIDHAVALTTNVYKFFGNSVYASREMISSKVGISDSHLQTQLSSCVQYGLLELKNKEGYKPTQLFTRIYKPLQTENVEDLKKEAFKNPELYKKVIQEHDNSVLTVDGLATILFRNYKVSEQASRFAAKVFLENARALKLINEENFFNTGMVLQSDVIEVEDEDDDSEREETPEYKFLPPPSEKKKEDRDGKGFQKSFNHPPIPIFLDGGAVAELYLPNGFNKTDLERVVKVITAYLS